MAWDWDKLNQHQKRSGPPPQMDEILKQLKTIKLPGGTIVIGALIVLAAIAYSSIFTINSGAVFQVAFRHRKGEQNCAGTGLS
jgi:modulator of FtsH protease HflK